METQFNFVNEQPTNYQPANLIGQPANERTNMRIRYEIYNITNIIIIHYTAAVQKERQKEKKKRTTKFNKIAENPQNLLMA